MPGARSCNGAAHGCKRMGPSQEQRDSGSASCPLSSTSHHAEPGKARHTSWNKRCLAPHGSPSPLLYQETNSSLSTGKATLKTWEAEVLIFLFYETSPKLWLYILLVLLMKQIFRIFLKFLRFYSVLQQSSLLTYCSRRQYFLWEPVFLYFRDVIQHIASVLVWFKQLQWDPTCKKQVWKKQHKILFALGK